MGVHFVCRALNGEICMRDTELTLAKAVENMPGSTKRTSKDMVTVLANYFPRCAHVRVEASDLAVNPRL